MYGGCKSNTQVGRETRNDCVIDQLRVRNWVGVKIKQSVTAGLTHNCILGNGVQIAT